MPNAAEERRAARLLALLNDHRAEQEDDVPYKPAMDKDQWNAMLDSVEAVANLADLDEVQASIDARRAELVDAKVDTIKVGDTVRFAEKISPKYVAGLTAVVTAVNDKSVRVQTPDDPAYGRFQNTNARLPKSLIAG